MQFIKTILSLLLTMVFILQGNSQVAVASRRKTFGLSGKDYRIPLTWIKEYGVNAGSIKYGHGDYGRIIEAGGKNRFYEIHIPKGYNHDKPAPVVLVLHGGGGYPAAVPDFDS